MPLQESIMRAACAAAVRHGNVFIEASPPTPGSDTYEIRIIDNVSDTSRMMSFSTTMVETETSMIPFVQNAVNDAISEMRYIPPLEAWIPDPAFTAVEGPDSTFTTSLDQSSSWDVGNFQYSPRFVTADDVKEMYDDKIKVKKTGKKHFRAITDGKPIRRCLP